MIQQAAASLSLADVAVVLGLVVGLILLVALVCGVYRWYHVWISDNGPERRP